MGQWVSANPKQDSSTLTLLGRGLGNLQWRTPRIPSQDIPDEGKEPSQARHRLRNGRYVIGWIVWKSSLWKETQASDFTTAIWYWVCHP